MAMIKWTPFRELENLLEDEDFFLPLARRGGFVPAIDIFESGDDVVVEASLPGIKPEDVDITVENQTLTIQGHTQKEEEQREKGYWRKEVRSGSFARSVQLPMAVEGEKARANYEDGVLKITIPKAEHAKAKKINVEVKESK